LDTVPGDYNLELIEEINKKGIPTILIDRKSDRMSSDSVTTNDTKAGYCITKYFIQNGRKNIAFLRSINDLSVAKDRLRGYKDALKDNGIDVNNDFIINNVKDNNPKEILDKVKNLINSGKKNRWNS